MAMSDFVFLKESLLPELRTIWIMRSISLGMFNQFRFQIISCYFMRIDDIFEPIPGAKFQEYMELTSWRSYVSKIHEVRQQDSRVRDIYMVYISGKRLRTLGDTKLVRSSLVLNLSPHLSTT